MPAHKNYSPPGTRLTLNRRRFLAYFTAAGLGSTLMPEMMTVAAQETDEITVDMVKTAEKMAGLAFPPEMRERFARELTQLRTTYKNLSDMNMGQETPPCLIFNPIPPGYETIEPPRQPVETSSVSITLPGNDEDIAFLPVTHLSALIKTRQITSTDLTKLYISRIKRYDRQLNSVITLTERLALEQAQRADEEIAAGDYRGTLHGIPYGLKDLISVKGYPTTWGAEPYKNQIIDTDATVYTRLSAAGAVLVAKLASGALASSSSYWFGGETKNPWNTDQPAGGSSGGSGASVAAGLVAFALGTETQGSIMNPSGRCGITGLRPTFGRVSRHGIMPLSWSMDKVGPMCRSAEDCAIVLSAMYGPDGYDMSVFDRPFEWKLSTDFSAIRAGYIETSGEQAGGRRSGQGEAAQTQQRQISERTLDTLKSLGITVKTLTLPESIQARDLGFILHSESAAMFDRIVRDGSIDTMENSSRPYTFRVRRFVPAAEYIQANRARTRLLQELNEAIRDYDIIFGWSTGLTNHTGHPAITFNQGFVNGVPSGFRFNGNLFKEAEMLAIARAFQNRTDHHLQRPRLS
ncbi:amidase [candidate division KSB1 bacterium]